MLPSTTHAQEPPPDLDTYTTWIREAFAAAQRNDRLGLEQVAERLITTEEVQLPDGSSIAVENDWLRESLEDTDPDLSAAAERLGAIIDALAQPESAAPDDALDRLQSVFERAPFREAEINDTGWQWLDAFFDWIGRLLDAIFSPIAEATPAGSADIIAWIIAGIGLILLIGVITYIVLGLRRSIVKDAEIPEDDPEAHLTAKTAFEQASDMARGGDYRTAVRYMYLSALLWLDERELLRYDRALTNREYLERVRDNPNLRTHLTPVVETFDRVWYGHATLDDTAFAAYREQVEALRKDAQRFSIKTSPEPNEPNESNP
ncbi:MAG: DUF4129 domain-containing protein [Chloroflexota bacterium]